MEEQIIETIRGILRFEFPEDDSGNPIVKGRAIKGWYFGETDLTAVREPSIVVQMQGPSMKNWAFGTQELTHQGAVKLYGMDNTPERGQRLLFEMARLVFEALLPHRILYVCGPCPLCETKIFTPQHYVIAHSAILGPYITQVQNDFEDTWFETHPISVPVPTLPDAGIGAEAFFLMCADVQNSVTVSGLADYQKTNILTNFANKRRMIRRLYDVYFTEFKQDNSAPENLHGGEFTITAKELVKQPTYGPDNVPTGTFALQE